MGVWDFPWTWVASSTQLGEKSYVGDLPSAGWVTRFVDDDFVIHKAVGDFADDIFAIYVVCGAFRERRFRHIQEDLLLTALLFSNFYACNVRPSPDLTY